jgi:hypothetical protein
MINIITELRSKIEGSKDKYKLYNQKNVLELPLMIPLGVSIMDFMDDFFMKYKILLEDSTDIMAKVGIKDHDKIIAFVENLAEAYKYMHAQVLSGNMLDAFSKLYNVLNENLFIPISISSGTFYRARWGVQYRRKEDFWHIPFPLRYLCDSYRFSISGYPCLYIGYTKEICKKEVGNDPCSVIQIELKGQLNLIDLTWDVDFLKDSSPDTFLMAYPIIAACYVVPFYCTQNEMSCKEIKAKFKEQYIFPQFVTMYIKKAFDGKIDGIRYFTTRDPNLDPTNNNGKDIVLFPHFNGTDVEKYDMSLIDKFDWNEITMM